MVKTFLGIREADKNSCWRESSVTLPFSGMLWGPLIQEMIEGLKYCISWADLWECVQVLCCSMVKIFSFELVFKIWSLFSYSLFDSCRVLCVVMLKFFFKLCRFGSCKMSSEKSGDWLELNLFAFKPLLKGFRLFMELNGNFFYVNVELTIKTHTKVSGRKGFTEITF